MCYPFDKPGSGSQNVMDALTRQQHFRMAQSQILFAVKERADFLGGPQDRVAVGGMIKFSVIA